MRVPRDPTLREIGSSALLSLDHFWQLTWARLQWGCHTLTV